MDYSIFPPINACLNSISAILLIVGLVMILRGHRTAHKRVMIAALITSALFLASYLTYHYGTGHTEFPKEYPLARKIYLAILIPHIILAVVNLPLIILLVTAALRGRFEKHKRLARITYPSWLFVSITGVVIYFMIYVWFPPSSDGVENVESGAVSKIRVLEKSRTLGDLVFTPGFIEVDAEASDDIVTVQFQIENRGLESIEITQLKSGCECLSVKIDADPIDSGGRATITGVFDIEKLRGPSERKITVATNQSERPVILSTSILVDPIYTLEPEMTQWEVGEAPSAKTIEFRVEREKPIRILSAESKRKEMRCELVTIEEGKSYDLILTPETTDSSLLGIVRVETDCEIDRYARPLAYFTVQ